LLPSAQGQNPFELLYRDNQTVEPSGESEEVTLQPVPDSAVVESGALEQSQKQAIPDSSLTLQTQTNPFEVNPPTSTPPPILTPPPEIPKEEDTSEESTSPEQNLTSTSISQFVLALLFILMLLILAIVVNLSKGLIGRIYRASLNENFSSLLYRERNLHASMYLYYLSYIVFFLNTGLFLYLMAHVFELEIGLRNSVWIFIACVALIYLTKHIILSFLGYVFPISKEINQYSFNILLFNILLGLLLIPVNLFIAFGPIPLLKTIAWFGISMVIVIYLLRQFRGYLISSRLITDNTFHFFVYLCTIEILPLLVLMKVFFK
jgi:hypothetical protein